MAAERELAAEAAMDAAFDHEMRRVAALAEPGRAGADASGATPDGAGPENAPWPSEPVTRAEIGRALAVMRVTRGWAQAELARVAGVHQSVVSTYERCRAMPELATVSRLVAALGYTLEDLQTALAFVRALAHGERMPMASGLNPRAHRPAANHACAQYECMYALLAARGGARRADTGAGGTAES